MLVVAKEIHKACKGYFHSLARTGYRKYSDVEELLALTSLWNILDSELSQYVTDKDFDAIVQAITGLRGSCLLTYHDYTNALPPIDSPPLGLVIEHNEEKGRYPLVLEF